jgi:hypothetical protein
MPKGDKWEYMYIIRPTGGWTSSEAIVHLDELGANGWELIQVVAAVAFFKRQIK